MRYETWMIKGFPSYGNITKVVFDTIQDNCIDPQDASKYANFAVSSMDRREQNGVGIFVFDGMVKGVLTSSMGNEDACNSRK